MQLASICHMFCDSSPFDIFATRSCLLWLFPIFAQLTYNRCFLRKSIAKKHKQNPMTHCAVVAGRKPCHENPVHAPAPDPLNLPNLELPCLTLPLPPGISDSRSPNNGKWRVKTGKGCDLGYTRIYVAENPRTQKPKTFATNFCRETRQTVRGLNCIF